MESGHHHFLLKLSRLFPSSFMTSCQLQTLPDIAETLTKPHEILHENDLSPFLKTPPNKICKHQKPHQECKRTAPVMSSSSNHSGWFSTSDDGGGTDAVFSLSSNSGESFPLMKTTTAFGRMKTIDELGGRLSLSSACSFDAVVSQCSRRKSSSSREAKKYSELGSDDCIPAEVYYGEFVAAGRRRKTAKSRRKSRRKRRSWMVEESYAVEKRSSDPYGDFRASMVEMIVEKQMVGAQELERLLTCFLCLNEVCYHGMIVDVFSEICQTLFSN